MWWMMQNQRYFHTDGLIGTCRLTWRISIDTAHFLARIGTLTDCAVSIWKWGMSRCLLRVDRLITRHRLPVFFRMRKSLLKKPREPRFRTGSMAPFSSLCTTSCSSFFLFRVGNWMSVLVREGRDSRSSSTPECRILADPQLPSRFF